MEKEKTEPKLAWHDHVELSAQMDTCWDKHTSENSYSGDLRVSVMMGNMTGLVIAIHSMSKRWAKCERKVDHLWDRS